MRLSEIITEAFDQPYPVKVQQQGKKYKAQVKLPDKTTLLIKFVPDMLDDQSWNISFVRNGSIDLTGQGDAMRIFATVMDATKQFINAVNPKEVTFAADKSQGASRSNLYKRLVSQFATSLGYKVSDIDDSDEDTVFYLRRMSKKK
jgi:hypothetical protein